METQKTLFVFDITSKESSDCFSYLGEVMTEVSVFANDERGAIEIIKRELGSDLGHRLKFRNKTVRTLFGKVAQVGLKDATHQEGVVYKTY